MFEILSGFALVVFRGTAIDLGDPHEREIDMYHTETAAVDVTGACARVAPLPSARRDLPDATLIAQIATGDRFAMHALFAHHKTRVYRFILRLVGDADSADDLTSEVFLAVWRHAHKFRGRAAASTWLLAIARFKALDELRRRFDTAPDLEQPDASDPAADPEASWADKHRGATSCSRLHQLTNRTARHYDRPKSTLGPLQSARTLESLDPTLDSAVDNSRV
jgi:RNA polymerase sigma factor (sigma-70 family)